ncbi:gamma carbonic anhydrase family protein [Fluviispira multicolorata]|uniref:Gamma carbonic anhydrase family protein n=1 Tax=Fluviispira multicolorata TaxID=2654512 RepID=A0A833JB20_9BACT|nr:gamma carbonic anhydrase family protein [Fluviispira multicolorata]KAB8027380.1 gamma carbonic anhydrase family protein [Fluviispira multicolorata]
MEQDLNQLQNKSPFATITAYRGILPKIPNSVFLADGARIIGDVEFGENCSVWFNAVVRADVHFIKVGENTNIQDGAVIHCTFQKNPTHIAKNVSIGHLAILHGCSVEEGCLIGMGATIMDEVVVGRESIVGAGSLITQGTQIPPRSLVIGSPAKVVRMVSDEEYNKILATTFRYLEYAKGYNFSNISKKS